MDFLRLRCLLQDPSQILPDDKKTQTLLQPINSDDKLNDVKESEDKNYEINYL